MKESKNTYSIFKNYLLDKLTDKERHAFEKNAAKSNFETEALEGLDTLQENEFLADVEKLKSHVSNKRNKKSIVVLLRKYNAAASLVLIIGMASYFYFTNRPDLPKDNLFQPPPLQEIKTQKEDLRLEENKPNILDQENPETPEESVEIIPEKSLEEEIIKDEVVMNQSRKKQQSKQNLRLERIAAPEITINENLMESIVVEETEAPKKISGTVLGADGEPLPGATVFIEKTNQGTVTDFDGNFNIEGDSTSEIVFDYIGFEQAIKPASDSMLVVMQQDESSLDEVVVVGYGTQKKKEFTGSVTSIKSKDLEKNIHPDLQKALSGTVAGVSIHKDSIGSILSLPPQGDLEDFIDWIVDSLDETLVSNDETIWVYLEFKIQKNGKISNLKFRNKINRKIRKEITRILKTSENWKPSMLNNLPVDEKILIKFEVY